MSKMKAKGRETIKLHIFKRYGGASGVIRNEQGQIVNENQLVSLKWGTPETERYLAQLNGREFAKVEIAKYLLNGEEAEIPNEIKAKVDEALNPPQPQKAIDPRDKEIDELKKQMAQLLANQSKPTLKAKKEEPKEEVETVSADDEQLKAEYQTMFGRKPHKNWSRETIIERMEKAGGSK